ncbi:MAG: hypothetical protein ACD_78C00314G0002 [uncultured bacterium (gcode 4)]|uniref:Uncharacterized protein n=1 Tax=uncultured bacterium (gcode 4) TaxID=1234023 RepID=K1XWW5_9BACT|nr:MAG: hypothetical protein ACD_78C00314G0002 [uncultured bacterium (gcode 4)]
MINKKWSIFLYALLLSFFAVIIGYIVLVKMDILSSNLDLQNYDTLLHANISEKAELAFKYDISLNTNGSGFVDTIQCPSAVTMSGTIDSTTIETIATAPYFNNTLLYCSGSTASGNLLLQYGSGFTTYATGSYLGSVIALTGTTVLTGTFTDGSGTYISFTVPTDYSGLDSNYNSDDYRPISSLNTPYPAGYTDDDDLGRRILYGYVKKDAGWYSAFNINTPLRKYIASNTFNTGGYSEVIGATATGYIRLDIDNPYNIKIVEFDKTIFEQTKELRFVSGSEASFSTGGIGWIMPNLSLSGTAPASDRRVFDFQNRDYALFLSFSGNILNSAIDFLKYQITMANASGSGLYIVPLDDTGFGMIKHLGFDIVIDSEQDYRYKQFEVVRENTALPLIENGCLFGAYFGSGCLFY